MKCNTYLLESIYVNINFGFNNKYVCDFGEKTLCIDILSCNSLKCIETNVN